MDNVPEDFAPSYHMSTEYMEGNLLIFGLPVRDVLTSLLWVFYYWAQHQYDPSFNGFISPILYLLGLVRHIELGM